MPGPSDDYLPEGVGCGANGCIFMRHGGIGTNMVCRCLGWNQWRDKDPSSWNKYRVAVSQMRDKIEALEYELQQPRYPRDAIDL